LPETFPAPFTARRERRDEEDENDAHSIEIKIVPRNESRVDQIRREENSRGLISA
jgi:hypothetical protein